MTSIAVKVEQRIELLIKKETGESPVPNNHLQHYLTYLLVRTVFRGLFMLGGKWMAQPKSIGSSFEILKISLYIFGGLSFYFAIHGICCFEELKVTFDNGSKLLGKTKTPT